MKEKCDKDDDKCKTPRSWIFNSFKEYCEDNANFMGKKEFFNRMEKKGYSIIKERGIIKYVGIQLSKEDNDDEVDDLDFI